MQPAPPFWFLQRQCKAEPAGDNQLKLTGPNLGEAFIHIEKAANGLWRAALRTTADGLEIASTAAEISSPGAAWNAAFELYRLHLIT